MGGWGLEMISPFHLQRVPAVPPSRVQSGLRTLEGFSGGDCPPGPR